MKTSPSPGLRAMPTDGRHAPLDLRRASRPEIVRATGFDDILAQKVVRAARRPPGLRAMGDLLAIDGMDLPRAWTLFRVCTLAPRGPRPAPRGPAGADRPAASPYSSPDTRPA